MGWRVKVMRAAWKPAQSEHIQTSERSLHAQETFCIVGHANAPSLFKANRVQVCKHAKKTGLQPGHVA